MGPFTGLVAIGPGSITVTTPSLTCVSCPIPVTIPGSSQTSPLPFSSGPVAGTSDGRSITFPVDGFPPITGSVSILGPSTQLALSWNFEVPDGTGGSIQIQFSATLNKN